MTTYRLAAARMMLWAVAAHNGVLADSGFRCGSRLVSIGNKMKGDRIRNGGGRRQQRGWRIEMMGRSKEGKIRFNDMRVGYLSSAGASASRSGLPLITPQGSQMIAQRVSGSSVDSLG